MRQDTGLTNLPFRDIEHNRVWLRLVLQLILADGSAEGVQTPAHDGVVVEHLRHAGTDVFALRALAAEAARGWVVAFTEDHCLPTDDWALQILQATDCTVRRRPFQAPRAMVRPASWWTARIPW